LFGFPVHVRSGFLMFMVLVVVINGADLGLWLAGFLAAFTLVHELGHATAARAAGARAEIALDFLYGYAAFVPTRPLSRAERAGISVAGPAAHIGVSLLVLVGMGVNPLDRADFTSSPAALAAWWAGPVIGLFNLLPVLPFDGGAIAETGMELVLGRRARVVMLYGSLVVTIAAAVWCVVTPRLSALAIFALIPLIAQIQMVVAHRERGRAVAGTPAPDSRALARAEAEAWATGSVHAFPPGTVPSPWFRAHQQLAAGWADVARDLIVADLRGAAEPGWWPPDAAPRQALSDLVDLLPDPLPTGRAFAEYVLADVLLRVGRHGDAARYAAAAFDRHPSALLAMCTARGAAALGDRTTALGWLRVAVRLAQPAATVQHLLRHAPELQSLRDDPEFAALTTAA
jgi:Zn-dependent protease